MTNDTRDLLTALKAELEFLEKGGYRNTARAAWRPHLVFQDSPTCLNFDPTREPKPCSECVLAQLIPQESATKKIPCRHIPLNERGETIDSFYRYGTAEELEAAFGPWLKQTIQRLEQKKSDPTPAVITSPESIGSHPGCRIYEVRRRAEEGSMFSTCANPDCRAAFNYREGHLFRFHKAYPVGEMPPNTQAIQHFWLCGNCSAQHTLAYEEGRGVMMQDHAEMS
jgi:hypothetical protein